MTSIETSKTHRLYLLLRERIANGVLRPGDRLPGEPALAAEHRLSRVTIRRALDGLARDGLITRQPGSGTYVTARGQRGAFVGDFSNMLQNLVAMGRSTRVRLLAFNYGEAPDHVAQALALKRGQRVQHSLRVRYMDDEPFSYLSTFVPEEIGVSYSEADLAQTPLLALLERSGVTAASADQTLSATIAGPEIAQHLCVEIGAPLISLTRVVRNGDGRGVEYLSALYRPDRHQFHMALTREGEGANRHWRPQASHPAVGNIKHAVGRRGAGSRRRRP